MNRNAILIAVLLAALVLVLWVASGSSNSPDSSTGWGRMAVSVLLFVSLAASLILRWQGSVSGAVQSAAVWLALFVGLIFAYSFKNDFHSAYDRFAGELNPALPVAQSENAITLRRASDGHFYADTNVNGVSMRMLADTGASAISLGLDDAKRAGIDIDQLQFDTPMHTANGTTQGARVVLDEVRVGLIIRHKVTAIVSRNLSGPVLGMNFFNTLSRFQIEKDQLLLQD